MTAIPVNFCFLFLGYETIWIFWNKTKTGGGEEGETESVNEVGERSRSDLKPMAILH